MGHRSPNPLEGTGGNRRERGRALRFKGQRGGRDKEDRGEREDKERVSRILF